MFGKEKKNDDYKEKDKLRIVVSEVSSFVGNPVSPWTRVVLRSADQNNLFLFLFQGP